MRVLARFLRKSPLSHKSRRVMQRILTPISRHPQYALLLFTVLVATGFLISGPSSSFNLFSPLLDQEYLKTAQWSLEEALSREEALYKKHLKKREELVKKYGPTSDLVHAFPDHGEYYTLWDFFIPAFQCPHRVERIGSLGDGGKWACGIDRISRQKSCVIYAIGLGGEVSYEAELLKRAPGCKVWGYDFSVKSIGPEIEKGVDSSHRTLADRAHFFPYAVGKIDDHASIPPKWTLPAMMKSNGHDFIDVLKIDIEGWEFDTLDAFLEPYLKSGRPLPMGQMQIEIHAFPGSGHSTFKNFKKWWEKLEAAGLRPFWTEPNLAYLSMVRGTRPDTAEYSFINIRGEHTLVSDKWIS